MDGVIWRIGRTEPIVHWGFVLVLIQHGDRIEDACLTMKGLSLCVLNVSDSCYPCSILKHILKQPSPSEKLRPSTELSVQYHVTVTVQEAQPSNSLNLRFSLREQWKPPFAQTKQHSCLSAGLHHKPSSECPNSYNNHEHSPSAHDSEFDFINVSI